MAQLKLHNSIPSIHLTARAVQDALARFATEGAWRKYDGPYLASLRSLLAKSLDREHARLCCSGTFAVELAVRSLQLERDEEVLLAAYDFPGNFRAIQDAGVIVCLCDVAWDNWVPTVEQLDAAMGPKTKAIVVSHLHGALAPMQSICDWAKQNGLWVIEDACQAHGACVDGKSAGGWGDLGVLSFGGSKLIASGRGGAVVTNNARFAQRMTIFCERGNDSYALSELQAAVILPQYDHLPLDHVLRLNAAKNLLEHLSQFEWLSLGPLRILEQPAFYKLGLIVRDSILKLPQIQKFVKEEFGTAVSPRSAAREFVLKRLFTHQIEIGPGFNGFFRRSANRCRQPVALTNSQIASESTLVLHHNHLLDPQTGGSTIECVKAAFDAIHEGMLR